MQSKLSEYLAVRPPGFSIQNQGEIPVTGFYHYTNYNGLLGILSTNRIWATNVCYLNDSTEFTHAIELMECTANQRLEKATDSRELAFTTSMLGRVQSMRDADIYVCSFSEQGDVLSQWRGYAGSNGVSIAFEYERLHEIAKSQNFMLVKCLYNDDEKKPLINSIMDYWLNVWIRGGAGRAEVGQALKAFMYDFLSIALAFKHKAFYEENEWRLVSRLPLMRPQGIGFRSTTNSLIPHYNFDLDCSKLSNGAEAKLNPINHIIIGPGQDYRKAKKAVRALLEQNGMSDVPIECSIAPYRTSA